MHFCFQCCCQKVTILRKGGVPSIVHLSAVSVAGDRGAPPEISSAPVGCKRRRRGAENKIGD